MTADKIKPLKIIGVGEFENAASFLYAEIVQNADVIGGSKRLLDSILPAANKKKNLNDLQKSFKGDIVYFDGKFSEAAEKLLESARRGKNVALLASGDPLYFGVGGYFTGRNIPVDIYPSLSSMQLLCSRAKVSWQDVYSVSLHGRPVRGLAQKINGRQKIIILTDERNTPQAIASYLREYNMLEYKILVGEDLGSSSEKTLWYSVAKLAAGKKSFSSLNILLLVHDGSPGALAADAFGLNDERFIRIPKKENLITKKEIRVLALSALNLREKSIVWDVGAGTGSLSVEAARLAKEGAVYAIEKNKDAYECMKKNSKKLRADFFHTLNKAPSGMQDWPNPDSVFIGGSGGELDNILELAMTRLNPGGSLVLNIITIETLEKASAKLRKAGYAVNITLAQISKSVPILGMTRFDAQNPVYIVSARKPDKKGIH